MSLFKNPNEVAYTGGKKHWTDVIKNSGPGDLLIWRQPEEDFNTNSTLIVMPGEVAIFIKGGTIVQSFPEGTHKLDTENYPFISRLRNAFSGGISTFSCVVYFVRKADSQEILWGTDSPIQVRDKFWKIRTDARVRGAYKVRIENPEVFLTKLIGNNVFLQSQEELPKYFQNELQGKIKSAVSKFLNSLEQELIGLDAYLDELSNQIEPYIDDVLKDYGLKCVKFSLAGLDIDIEKYDDIDDFIITGHGNDIVSKSESIAKGNLAQGDKVVMDILGDDWGRQQSANILGDLSNNPGAGGIAAAGAGMGMGFAAGSVFGSMADQMFAPMKQKTPPQPVQPIQPTPSGRFAPKTESTTKPETKAEDPAKALLNYKALLDAGAIDQNEYDTLKAEMMRKMMEGV